MGFNFKRLPLLSRHSVSHLWSNDMQVRLALYNSIGVNEEPQRPLKAPIFIFLFFVPLKSNTKRCVSFSDYREYSSDGITLAERVRCSGIIKQLWVKLLLLHIEKSYLRWFWHLIRKPPGHFPAYNLEEFLKGLYVHLAWECLMITQKELEDLTVETDVWTTSFSLQPQQSPTAPETKWMEVHQ